MFKKLRIQNFKAWEDTGEIRMAPLTLFFGTNSSGKSSIGQFLMMLRQTVELQDRKVVFYPGSDNTAVQLGSYQEMVYRRNMENDLSFEYHWRLPRSLEFKDALSGRGYRPDEIHFEARTGTIGESGENPILKEFYYDLYGDEDGALRIGMKRSEDAAKGYGIEAKGYDLVRNMGSRENGEDRSIQLIIETHSEHFLTRLQRRIAEKSEDKRIASEQVSAYFEFLCPDDMQRIIDGRQS